MRRALLVLAVLGGLFACGAERDEELARGAAEWVEQVRSVHAAADAALARGEPERASALLRSQAERPPPEDVLPVHRRAVQQDLWFRVAQLEQRAQRSDEALACSERGLALGHGDDLFTANLLIARGEALEGAGRDTEAAASYYEALEINRELLRRALAQPAEAP